MAFMMPVLKNDYDIYKSARSRRTSECSNPCRSRKVSECSRSDGPSLSTSPGSDYMGSPAHRSSVPISVSRQSRSYSSRNSQSSLQSPIKSNSSSPPKSNSTNSLNKFHNRLVDKLKRSLKCKDSSDGESTVREELLETKSYSRGEENLMDSTPLLIESKRPQGPYKVKRAFASFFKRILKSISKS